MKEAKDVTCCVVDHGLFVPLALKLSETYKRVLYWTPAERDFPTVNEHVVGDGYPNIERCKDFWPIKKEIDLFVFPDIQHSGLQLELESQGFAVWGSRTGDSLEINRERFHEILGEVGLEVPKFEVVVGLSKLREHLRDQTDKYLKVSKFRGSFETFHWRDQTMDGGALDVWAVHLGPVAELVRFLVFDAIPTELEIGGDTYNVRGQFPKRMMHGLECKDKGYLGEMTDTDIMPEQVKAVMEAFAPILKEHNYTNLWSMEIRVTDDGFKFIDPCCRFPCPGSGSQLMLYKNFAEIVWGGANGELVEPETKDEVAAEVMLTMKGEKDAWHCVEWPAELKDHVKCRGACLIDGKTCLPPHEAHGDEIGYLGATGKDIEQ